DEHRITDFLDKNGRPIEAVPAGYCKDITVMVDDGDGNMVPKVVTPCPVTNYTLGGFGQYNDSAIDSVQGRVIGTSLFTLAGHHVAKAGAEIQYLSYKNVRAWSGGTTFRESGNGSNYNDFRQYGFLTGPDE